MACDRRSTITHETIERQIVTDDGVKRTETIRGCTGDQMTNRHDAAPFGPHTPFESTDCAVFRR
jgi:hypothetical protein